MTLAAARSSTAPACTYRGRVHRLSTARSEVRTAGLPATAAKIGIRALQHVRYRRDREQPWAFEYQGRTLPAFFHPYNRTWLGERTVEVAIAQDFLRRQPAGASGMEIGNVLAHYGPVSHRVVDKYEIAPGVENIDVVDLQASELDFIVALSTLEHVGWDEPLRDTTKIGRAVTSLLQALRPGGRMLLTLPLGYNPGADVLVVQGTLPTETEVVYVRDLRGRWKPRALAALTSADFRYEHHLHSAHAVWVGELRG